MGKSQRTKGAVGERELANKLKQHGYDCRRGQQYCGANGDADVVGLPNLHIECKRTEALSLYKAMSQAIADAKESEIPVVMHRRNNCKWLAVLDLDDFMEIYKEWEAGKDINHTT